MSQVKSPPVEVGMLVACDMSHFRESENPDLRHSLGFVTKEDCDEDDCAFEVQFLYPADLQQIRTWRPLYYLWPVVQTRELNGDQIKDLLMNQCKIVDQKTIGEVLSLIAFLQQESMAL